MSSKKSETGNVPPPSWPTTAVVIPCNTWLDASGLSPMPRSAWLCMSMKPGATIRPAASMTRSPARADRKGATSAMVSPLSRTSARRAGLPLPSMTVPPEIRIVREVSWMSASQACRRERQEEKPAHAGDIVVRSQESGGRRQGQNRSRSRLSLVTSRERSACGPASERSASSRAHGGGAPCAPKAKRRVAAGVGPRGIEKADLDSKLNPAARLPV